MQMSTEDASKLKRMTFQLNLSTPKLETSPSLILGTDPSAKRTYDLEE